ncbi:hypothetical protein C8R44DRAFT_752011 [Mycena epipterygia]|nr:hypothetical protein C8R44DRAFT_752011 [Mycena epipterygia]
MSSLDAPRLTKAEEDAIRTLHKSVRATRYEDSVDQDAFLVASARSVLQFRDQVASFALTPEVGECVFAICAQMQLNNTRLGTPPDDVFSSITDFAGEIVRTRQLYRDRKRAQDARVCAAEGVAARAERREALKYAAKLRQKNLSPDEDTVSIPSDDEEPDVRKRPRSLTPPTGTANMDTASPIQARSTALLSPLAELESLMFSIRLSSPTVAPPASPLSPAPSLPDLVPIVSPNPLANGRARVPKMMSGPPFDCKYTVVHNPPNMRMPIPTTTSLPNAAVLVPRPVKSVPRRPNLNFVDDLRMLRPKSTGSHARKNTSSGSYNRSRMPPVANRKPKVPPERNRTPSNYFFRLVFKLVQHFPQRVD